MLGDEQQRKNIEVVFLGLKFQRPMGACTGEGWEAGGLWEGPKWGGGGCPRGKSWGAGDSAERLCGDRQEGASYLKRRKEGRSVAKPPLNRMIAKRSQKNGGWVICSNK